MQIPQFNALLVMLSTASVELYRLNSEHLLNSGCLKEVIQSV